MIEIAKHTCFMLALYWLVSQIAMIKLLRIVMIVIREKKV